jgi:RND family efflux transporter MFP subunit
MMVSRTLFLPALVLLSSAASAVPVTVGRLADNLVDHEVSAPAMVVPANRAQITAQVTALIRIVHVDVGAEVLKDTLLISLDDDDARLAVDRALADLQALDAQIAQAAARLKRGEDLIASNFISDDDMLERRTTVAVLQANRVAQELALRNARLNLARTRITAPFAATVVARSAQVGSLAQPGSALLTLVQSSHREVDADLDPRYADRLAAAERLRFVSQGRSWPLQLARVSSVIDPASRIRKGRFLFAADTAPIGASGEVTWLDSSGLLPVPLIVQRDGRLGVFVADGNRARFVPLPEAQEGRPAATSLPADTLVVIRGQARLQDNDELQISRQ